MTRKSIVELLAQANTTLPDNNSGLITPAVVRDLIVDFLDTVAPAYGVLAISGSLVKACTPTLTLVVFTTNTGATANGFTIDALTGTVTKLNRGTTRFSFNCDVQFAANRAITFALFINGVQTSWGVSNQGDGTGDPQSVGFSGIAYVDTPNAVFQVFARTDANTNVTLSSASFVCENVPVNSFT